MHLRQGGLDIFYIDESHDGHVYVATAISVPFLRQIEGRWTIVWGNHFQAAKDWRRRLKREVGIPTSKELHGLKLASGRGNYNRGKHRFDRPRARGVYRRVLETIDFLPPASIMSCAARRGQFLYGNERLEAAMYALFQRMRRRCIAADANAIAFFDQGHPEYRKLYRQSQVYLPTGSQFGSWGTGATQNLPLDMFTKDANEKNSKHCFFTQAADLLAYVAFLKVKGELGELEEWQSRYSWGSAYESIPAGLLNVRASSSTPRDAIVRLR